MKWPTKEIYIFLGIVVYTVIDGVRLNTVVDIGDWMGYINKPLFCHISPSYKRSYLRSFRIPFEKWQNIYVIRVDINQVTSEFYINFLYGNAARFIIIFLSLVLDVGCGIFLASLYQEIPRNWAEFSVATACLEWLISCSRNSVLRDVSQKGNWRIFSCFYVIIYLPFVWFVWSIAWSSEKW